VLRHCYASLRPTDHSFRAHSNDMYFSSSTSHSRSIPNSAGLYLHHQAFYAAIVSLAKAGDEVILPTPYYFNHEMTLTQLGNVQITLKD
jgi:hypothetical protein